MAASVCPRVSRPRRQELLRRTSSFLLICLLTESRLTTLRCTRHSSGPPASCFCPSSGTRCDDRTLFVFSSSSSFFWLDASAFSSSSVMQFDRACGEREARREEGRTGPKMLSESDSREGGRCWSGDGACRMRGGGRARQLGVLEILKTLKQT